MRINSIVIAMSFIWLLVSFWNRNDLPQNIDYAPEILNEPLQTATRKPSFDVSYNGVEYLVEPEYAYDLYGLIVSYRHHDDDNLHLMANDYLNMLDVCVVWAITQAIADFIKSISGTASLPATRKHRIRKRGIHSTCTSCPTII